MGYWPSVRSRWLDIDHVFFACLWNGKLLEQKKRGQHWSSHLDWIHLVNKINGFFINKKKHYVFAGHSGLSRSTVRVLKHGSGCGSSSIGCSRSEPYNTKNDNRTAQNDARRSVICFIIWRGKSERPNWSFLGRDCAIRTVSVETVIACVFFAFESRQIQNKHGPSAI